MDPLPRVLKMARFHRNVESYRDNTHNIPFSRQSRTLLVATLHETTTLKIDQALPKTTTIYFPT